ncbi:MAG: hypothetical protein JWP29_1413 [Rhodoferax sp.]|nr:hypothetical protein [Rhodoferax sp.]
MMQAVKQVVLGLTVALVALVAGCGGGSEPSGAAPAKSSAAYTEAMTGSAVQGLGETLVPRRAEAAPMRTRTVSLPVLLPHAAADSTASGGSNAPRQMGFARDVQPLATSAALAAQLEWHIVPGGQRVAAISVTSPEAKALRLGVLVHSLPPDAKLRVYAHDATQAQEIQASDILLAGQRNLAAGGASDVARTYWTPLVEGAETTLEIELAASADMAQLDIAISKLSHLTEAPLSASVARADQARVLVVKDGDSYACTGVLLNDAANSGIPYFLASQQCITNQTQASSVQTVWRKDADTASRLGPRTVTGGAVLLYGNAGSDVSLLRLNSPPPKGAVYAGWTAPTPEAGAVDAAVDPVAAPLKNADAETIGALKAWLGIASSTTVAARAAEVTAVPRAAAETRSAVYRFYNAGTGAHFFTVNVAERDNVIINLKQFRYEGPVFYAYTQAAADLKPVYRFYNTQSSAHFYTMDAAERDYVIANFKQFSYEGPVWYARGDAGDGATALYRFFRLTNNAHFYTMDAAERDAIRASLPDFRYEGPVYYVWNTGAGAAPVPVVPTTPSGPVTFPLAAAYGNYMTAASSFRFTASGVISGIGFTASGTTSQNDAIASTFENAPALTNVRAIDGAGFAQGQTIPFYASSQRFFDANRRLVGEVVNGTYTVVSSDPLPESAAVGASGVLSRATTYESSAKRTVLGSSTLTYSLESDSATLALLRVVLTGAGVRKETLMRVTTAGAVQLVSEPVDVSGSTVMLNYTQAKALPLAEPVR